MRNSSSFDPPPIKENRKVSGILYGSTCTYLILRTSTMYNISSVRVTAFPTRTFRNLSWNRNIVSGCCDVRSRALTIGSYSNHHLMNLSSSNRRMKPLTRSMPFMSTESRFYSPLGWWKDRQEKKETVKFKERITVMAEQESWLIDNMLKELDESTKSWAANLLNKTEIDMVKQVHKTLSGIAGVVGADADIKKVNKMTRKEKLQCAINGETTVEDINLVIDQFSGMSLMHRVLRGRHLDKKPLPEDTHALQTLVRTEGQKYLTKEQKEIISKKQSKEVFRRR